MFEATSNIPQASGAPSGWRASRPKVKTGCNNCKTRRVKCDETRPQCLKCTTSGRRCDGYPKYKRVDGDASWWECDECAREVDSKLWGFICPDCAFVNVKLRDEVHAKTKALKPDEFASTAPIGHTLEDLAREINSSGISENQSLGIDATGTSSIEVQESIQSSHSTQRWQLCHIVILVAILTFVASLTIALWWSMTRKDVSGGFTMAAYVVAVGGLPLASIQMRHSQKCQCWKAKRRAGLDGIADQHDLRSV